MTRPRKNTVDYFPHYCVHKTTMYILEQKYGNDGYAFWFKLLEMIGATEGHYIDLNNDLSFEFLQAKTRLDGVMTCRILDLLSKLGAIDPDLWSKRLIWCQNFIENVSDVYKNRKIAIPEKPVVKRLFPVEIPTVPDNYEQKPLENESGGITSCSYPQRRVEYSKENNPPTPLQGCETVSKSSHRKINNTQPLSESCRGAVDELGHDPDDHGGASSDMGHDPGKRLSRSKHSLTKAQESLFDRFWEAYPKKLSKGQAEKAWKSIKPDEQLVATMIATIERAKTLDDWMRDGGKFIPYPATWLASKRWLDEPDLKMDLTFDPNAHSRIEMLQTAKMILECDGHENFENYCTSKKLSPKGVMEWITNNST